MDDAKAGAAFRAVRIRSRLTQLELARQASARTSDVSHLERGLIGGLEMATIRNVAAALGMWVDLRPRWRGVDLDLLTNRAHAALQASVLRRFALLPGWTAVPEASYSIYGERGAIDVLAWHEATRTLLVIELKTFLVEAAELVRKMDERLRLAPRIGADRGWAPLAVAQWVILTDTKTNRRHVADHAEVLSPLTSLDGRAIRRWLRRPDGGVSALSFWSEPDATVHRRVRKVRRAASTEAA